MNDKIQPQSSQLVRALNNTIKHVSQHKTAHEINITIEELLMQFSESDFVELFIFDVEKQELYTKKENNVCIPTIGIEGILGEVFLRKKPVLYNYIVSEKSYVLAVDNPHKLKLKAQVVVPILKDDSLVGIVRISRFIRHSKVYTKEESELLITLQPLLIKIIGILTSHDKGSNDIALDTEEMSKQIMQTKKENNNPEINKSMIFFSNTVHDIRTPANSLYGFLELIEEHIEDKRIKGFVKNAKESAKFINSLTTSILEQVKQNHEIATSKPTTVNSIKFFSQIANLFSANMYDKKITYIIYIDPKMPKEILIDEIKLKRIIINLIGNAYKFTPAGKRIDFSVNFHATRKALDISVKDKGIGIDKSKQKDIFKAFKQAEDVTSIHFGGTGLGLSICSKYISDLGGHLHLQSVLDEGSTFSFTIPVTVINSVASYPLFEVINKNITILTDILPCADANNIKRYLIELGMPSENVIISNRLDEKADYLFCFQHKLSSDILLFVANNKIELIVVEEKLFSLREDPETSMLHVISDNTYYGDIVHETIFSKKKMKILLVDDNKINTSLLESMLETEYVEITSVDNGERALKNFKKSHKSNSPFDVIFLDKHMPSTSGTEVMQTIRDFERTKNVKPVFAISITGDPHLSSEEKTLYNHLVTKPFNMKQVRDAIVLVER